MDSKCVCKKIVFLTIIAAYYFVSFFSYKNMHSSKSRKQFLEKIFLVFVFHRNGNKLMKQTKFIFLFSDSRRSDPLTYTQTTASDMYDQHHQQSYPKYFRPNQYSAQRTPSYPPPPPPPPAQFNSTGRSHLCFGRKK